MILYFPSSPIISLYEKQAASGRAPAGMSGIFGWRVVPGETVVHIVLGFRDEARDFLIESASLLASRRLTILFVKNQNNTKINLLSMRNRLDRSKESLGPKGTDNILPIPYTRPWRFLSTVDKLLSLLEPQLPSHLPSIERRPLSRPGYVGVFPPWSQCSPRVFRLTLILICPSIVHFYYSHILPIFTFIVSPYIGPVAFRESFASAYVQYFQDYRHKYACKKGH